MEPGKPSRSKPRSATNRRARMRCGELMKPVHCVRETDTVLVAARVMREADVGFLPVRDEDGVVVGILTDRDIATRVVAADGNASTTPASSVMTRGVIACGPDDAVSRAEALMGEHRITRLVITDSLQTPVGVLSLSDLAQYERPAKVGRTLQTVAERKYAPERP